LQIGSNLEGDSSEALSKLSARKDAALSAQYSRAIGCAGSIWLVTVLD